MCSRCKRIVFNNQDDLKRFISEWNESVVEDIRGTNLKAWLKSNSVPFDEGLGSLKTLEVFTKQVLGDTNSLIAPLFYLNDLRIWADHKGAEEKFIGVIKKLGLQNPSHAELSSRLIEDVYSFFMNFFAILDNPKS